MTPAELRRPAPPAPWHPGPTAGPQARSDALAPLTQIAASIRHLLNNYTKPIPAVLEIPSKDVPYDPSEDSILSRVKFMFGES